ncbi:MAG: hypothetical protein PHP89_01990 [Candidatus Omnitrophica bacterium]|jgi:hypothetical protein|nr:hypothetical protein [Candidatus Omnitrophota bacterium]MDD4982169.1 hypothetical protein [Candidatus Omnitrophota bacterium]MDD5665497.1 hypothetical protein [Candidatus Omnitrophota bacterium]
MFTKEDYKNYFSELENIIKKSVVIYTDLINLVDDRSIHNRLHAMVQESMGNFRVIAGEKERLI